MPDWLYTLTGARLWHGWWLDRSCRRCGQRRYNHPHSRTRGCTYTPARG